MPPTTSASPALARVINDRLTLDAIAGHGPISRAELRAATGLSQPSMLDVVSRLLEAGLIEAAGESGIKRRGPNAQLYDISRRQAAVAVRVDGDRLHAVVTDLRGIRLGEAQRPVDESEPADQVASAVHAATRASEAGGLNKDGEPRAVELGAAVVGIHGPVDPHDGDLGFAWDLPHWQHRVVERLRLLLPCRVRLEHDIMLAAISEQAHGAARGREDFAVLWMGTGLGCAIFLDGRPLRGASGGAGEIGYMPTPGARVTPLPLEPGPRAGFQGGLQSLIGAAALQDLAEAHGADRDLTSLSQPGTALLGAAAERIAVGLASLCTLTDPGHIVLAGPIGQAGGPALAAAVEDALRPLSPTPTTVAPSALPDDGIIAGAVSSAVDDARDALWGSLSP